jgi:16S rRNA (guanine527-N7)-methyltransferase
MMVRHLEMIAQWRPKVNLTAVSDIRDAAVLHAVDSLTLFKVIPRGEGVTLLDIGTGAGFPGVVLLLADPSIKLTLLDRGPKKIVFLKMLAKELGLRRVEFLNLRVEELLENPMGKEFDVIASRAVFADLSRLYGFARLLKQGGLLVRMAGPSARSDDFDLKNFRRASQWTGTLPFSNAGRQVIGYRRIG